MIEATNVSKTFGNIKAVDKVSAVIEEGAVFGLIGTNGAGKSTFLRMIAGILKAEEGKILVDEEPIFENEMAKYKLFYISDEQFFFPSATPLDMKRFYQTIYPEFDGMRFLQMLEKFELSGNRKINSFSKGMKKQISILLGICSHTPYLLCDETFDGLDPVMRQAVKSIFVKEMEERSFTPIIASHNLRELEDICDHIGLLHKGGILLSKDLEDMKLNIHKLQCVFQTEEDLPYLRKVLEILQEEQRGSLVTITVRGKREYIEQMVIARKPIFYEFFYRNPTNIIIVSILAVICGMGGFFYLFSKKQVDFYHSLPVKREKLFLVSYLNGIFIYFIPYVICAGISFVISISYIGFSGEVLKGFLMNLFITGIFFLFLYEIVILAVILTGNKLSCFLMLGTLCFYMIATKGICIGYHDIFFDTFYYNGNLLAENRLTSPVIAILYGTIYWFNGVYDEFSGIDRPMMMFLLQCLGFAIFYGILNVWLFKKRPSEAAGRSIAFPMIQDIYRILLEIPFALGCGIFFCCITIRNNTAWLLFGILFGLLVSHFLLESLFHMDVKKALSHKLQLVITGGLLCLLAVSMRYDWWRYDAYLPKENKIKSMAISINGMIETDIVYYLEDTKEYSYSDQYILENMDIIDYEPIYEIAKKAVEAQNQKEREEGTYTWCKIKYSLTNGKDVYREYYIKREDDLLTQIINKPEYKNNVYQILTLKDEYIDELWVENIETEKSLLLEKEDIAQFLSIYRKELNELNFEEIKQTYPTAEISFRYKNGRIRGYQIYPSFTETRKYLKDLGFETKDNPGSFDSEGIESITVKVEKWIYEEEASYEKVDMGYDENVFIKEYTDIEQIKELCENLQVLEYYYKYHNTFLKGVKNDYIYVIGKKRMKDGSLEQIEGYYIKEQIPNLIKEDFKIKE